MPPPFTSFGSTGLPPEILKEVSASILFFSHLSSVVAVRRLWKFLILVFLAQNSDS